MPFTRSLASAFALTAAVAASVAVGAEPPSVPAISAAPFAASDRALARQAFFDSGPVPVMMAAGGDAPRMSDDGLGSPPSGAVPILFNDRHVYAKPDELRRGRLLAALVHHGTILVPLRTLFAQMGATTEYDPASRTAYVHRSGTAVRVTVGKPTIDIDGEIRPLDVPPQIYHGSILVPVRVISEALGAYVQWLPDRHAVAIRYLTGPMQPASLETPVPLAVATALPTPRPRRTVGPGLPFPKPAIQPETFLAIDPLIDPRVANEFAPNIEGASGTSYSIRGAGEFDLFGAMFELDGSYDAYRYAHPTGQVSFIGTGAGPVPAFLANEYQTDVHVGAEISPEKFYLAFAYTNQTTNYGYPRLSGIGLGLNKLPVLDRKISYEGSLFYFPNLSGTCSDVTCPQGSYDLAYKAFRYSAGLTALLGHRVFVEAGYRGDKLLEKSDAPSNITHGSPYAGLGIRL